MNVVEDMVRRWRHKLILLVCFLLTIAVIYITNEGLKVGKRDRVTENLHLTRNAHRSSYLTDTVSRHMEPITVFLRMAGKLKQHRTRFYCDFFRATVLFWPASFGKTVVVLDEESEQDHAFGNNLMEQILEHFPDRTLEVLYEPLPKDQSILRFRGQKTFGYNRQLWSSFFIDLYSTDKIVAWMDTDAAFITPVTESSIFNGKRLRILGTDCTLGFRWVKDWARNTESALGVPMVADFMTYFLVYLYRDTFMHCRQHILRRFNTSNFEEAFNKFYHKGTRAISPVIIIISYAWFFERDRYDWNLKVCNNLDSYNKRFPFGNTIGPEHTANILSEPQTAFHVPYAAFLSSNILVSYCLSHAAAGNTRAICSYQPAVSLSNNLVLFNHDLQRVKNLEQTPCTGNNKEVCLDILKLDYNTVGLKIKTYERRIEWLDLETVEKLADKVDIVCKSIKQ